MYEIDKKKLGLFIAGLRRERGLTQKELAQMLFLSDKAVSKWETGVSIPDTSTLVPLAEALGVSVSELLMQQRLAGEKPLGQSEVEALVKTAISLSGEEAPASPPWRRAAAYALSLILGAAGLWVSSRSHQIIGETVLTAVILGTVFGAYFCFFARKRLPDYYDSNRIQGMQDGFFRMNVPGLVFNNSNWPHILRVGRLWSLLVTGCYPWLDWAGQSLLPAVWPQIQLYVYLVLLLGGLFVPVYIAGKKYQ